MFATRLYRQCSRLGGGDVFVDDPSLPDHIIVTAYYRLLVKDFVLLVIAGEMQIYKIKKFLFHVD